MNTVRCDSMFVSRAAKTSLRRLTNPAGDPALASIFSVLRVMAAAASTETTRDVGFGSAISFFGSDGIFASNLPGLAGVTTMKMMRSTRRTSMSGVTFISGFVILISINLLENGVAGKLDARRAKRFRVEV